MEQQKPLPVFYKGLRLNVGYRAVELKEVERLEPGHEPQLLSYLCLSGCRVGLLLNFNAKILKDGIKRLMW